MPIYNNKISYFIKNEASCSVDGGSYSNYTGIGAKVSDSGFGSIEGMVAVKPTDTKIGGFAELKYTSPKIKNSDWSIESRTRAIVEKPYKEKDVSSSMTERVALKGSWNLGKGFSIYEIAGINSKISLDDGQLKSVTPTSITGVGYNASKKVSLYTEAEFSSKYSVPDKTWEKNSPTLYFGAKFTF